MFKKRSTKDEHSIHCEITTYKSPKEMVLELIKRNKTTDIVAKEQPVIVSVPDIKDYLIKEYERAKDLVDKIKELESQLKETEEIKLKYEAAMVTLDEYSKRLERSDERIDIEKQKTKQAKEEVALIRDKLNSYKIRFNDIAVTKEEIKGEVIKEFKTEVVSKINSHKGSISKKIACEIIDKAGE